MFNPNLFILDKDGTLDRQKEAAQSLSWARPNLVIISRALCAFERIRSSADVSAAKRRKAAELQARLNSPFEQPGLFLVESGEDFIGWTWDAKAFESQSGLPVRFGVPESADLNLPDGLHLLKSIDGYEGRLVEDGKLVQSRWWPQSPTPGDWRLFLAGSNQRFGASDLPTEPVLGLNQDQISTAKSAQPLLSRLSELPISTQLSWASLLILPVAAFIGVHLLSLTIDNYLTANEVEGLEVELADKRATANQLRQTQTQLQGYASLNDSVSYLLPLSLVLEKIDTVEGRPRSIRVFDNRLEFIFRSNEGDFDPVAWVREFEQTSALSQVSLAPTTQRQEWVIEAQIESANTVLAGLEP